MPRLVENTVSALGGGIVKPPRTVKDTLGDSPTAVSAWAAVVKTHMRLKLL